MPLQVRERGCIAPDIGGGGGGGGKRSMGRLGGGVSQMPALLMASEDLLASKESLPIFEKTILDTAHESHRESGSDQTKEVGCSHCC